MNENERQFCGCWEYRPASGTEQNVWDHHKRREWIRVFLLSFWTRRHVEMAFAKRSSNPIGIQRHRLGRWHGADGPDLVSQSGEPTKSSGPIGTVLTGRPGLYRCCVGGLSPNTYIFFGTVHFSIGHAQRTSRPTVGLAIGAVSLTHNDRCAHGTSIPGDHGGINCCPIPLLPLRSNNPPRMLSRPTLLFAQ
jgi:hypothetical protein